MACLFFLNFIKETYTTAAVRGMSNPQPAQYHPRRENEEKGKTTERGGRGRDRGRRREREGMCRYIHILIEKRRERGWLSMRGVVAPPPPSNDQAETTFGVADPHTSFSTSILPPPRSFPIPRSSSQASHPSYPKNNCAFRGLLIRA